jgi:hypothetical protein
MAGTSKKPRSRLPSPSEYSLTAFQEDFAESVDSQTLPIIFTRPGKSFLFRILAISELIFKSRMSHGSWIIHISLQKGFKEIRLTPRSYTGLQPDVSLQVFHQTFHVHSAALKLKSAFFCKFLDSEGMQIPGHLISLIACFTSRIFEWSTTSEAFKIRIDTCETPSYSLMWQC